MIPPGMKLILAVQIVGTAQNKKKSGVGVGREGEGTPVELRSL